MRAAVFTGRADVADVAVRRGTNVAKEIVMSERQGRERRDVQRNDELRTGGQRAVPTTCHLAELYSRFQ